MHTRPLLFACLAALAPLAAGCSTTPGNQFAFLSGGHRQIDAAKQLRAAYPQPLALPRELDKRVAPPFVVEPGDVLLVQPADLDSPVRLPGDQAVLPDGTIQLGRYGRVQVAGRTLEEIETVVKEHVQAQAKDAGPITVRLVTRQSKVFYVLGEVNAPGAFTFNGRETVLDALLAAGGLTDRASRDRVTLSRPTAPCNCRVVLPICYNEIVQIGDTSTNYQIQAGDRIYVPTKTLKEELCGHKEKPCPPCGAPQSPCPLEPIQCPPAAPAAACGPWCGGK
jgi:protein involved in polysaccharide export with SLBB domain